MQASLVISMAKLGSIGWIYGASILLFLKVKLKGLSAYPATSDLHYLERIPLSRHSSAPPILIL